MHGQTWGDPDEPIRGPTWDPGFGQWQHAPFVRSEPSERVAHRATSRFEARQAALVAVAGPRHVGMVEEAIERATAGLRHESDVDAILVRLPVPDASAEQCRALKSLYTQAGWQVTLVMGSPRSFRVGHDGAEQDDHAVETVIVLE